MQYGTTNQLNIIMHHVPGNGITPASPAIFINIAFQCWYNSFYSRVLSSSGCCRCKVFVLFETAAGFLHRKSFRQDLLQYLLQFFIRSFFVLSTFINGIAAIDIFKGNSSASLFLLRSRYRSVPRWALILPPWIRWFYFLIHRLKGMHIAWRTGWSFQPGHDLFYVFFHFCFPNPEFDMF